MEHKQKTSDLASQRLAKFVDSQAKRKVSAQTYAGKLVKLVVAVRKDTKLGSLMLTFKQDRDQIPNFSGFVKNGLYEYMKKDPVYRQKLEDAGLLFDTYDEAEAAEGDKDHHAGV